MKSSHLIAFLCSIIICTVAIWAITDEFEVAKSNSRDSSVPRQEDDDVTESPVSQEPSLLPNLRYEALPFPAKSPSKQACDAVDDEYRQAQRSFLNELERKASMMYFAGQSKESIAMELWREKGWPATQRWYTDIVQAEAITRHIDLLKNEPSAAQLVERFERDFAKNSEMGNVMVFSEELGALWQSIQTDTINELLSNGSDAQTIVAEVEATLTIVPVPLLEELQLSPISGITKSLVSLGRLDVAAILLEKYPSLVSGKNQFEDDFRSQVLASIGDHLSSEQVPKGLKPLITSLNFQAEPLHLYKIEVALFSNEKVFATIEKLASLSIDVPFVTLNDVQPEVTNISLDVEQPQLPESKHQIMLECKEVDDWLDSRTKSASEWKSYNRSDFVDSVTNSFEFQYCDSQQVQQYGGEFVSDVRSNIDNIRRFVVENNFSIAEMDLSQLPTADLTNDIKSVIGAVLTDELINDHALKPVDVKSRISAAGLAPTNTSSELLLSLISFKNFDIWFDELNFNDIDDSYKLLNQLAFQGDFTNFSRLLQLSGTGDHKLLDPFYFFIKGFSPLQSSGANSFIFNESANNQFIEYFLQSGNETKSHHLRAAFAKKHANNDAFEKLLVHFPQLSQSESEHYFDVKCEN